MQEQAGEVQPQRDPSVTERLFERRRVVLFVGLLLVELSIFVAGLATPLSASDQQSLENQTSTQFASVPTATSQQLFALIFTHNATIGLLELVPVFGALLFVYSIYVTGLVAQVLAASAGYPRQFGAVLFAFPYAFVELSGYAVAVAAGIMLLVALRRKSLRREAKVFAAEASAVMAFLIAAAAMETATRFSLYVGLALWAPTGIAVAAFETFRRRLRT